MAALYTKRLNEAFAKLDTNKDGQLSKAEFSAGSPVPQRPLADPAKVVSELDSNKDQKVSLTEFSATTLANFDRVDANHDGMVTPDEAQKARGAGR
jgi:Ca2+-binding EF-hand superfamily protein